MKLPQILNFILEEITKVLGLKGGTVLLVKPKTNSLQWAASIGVNRRYIEKGPVDLDKSVQETMTGIPVLVLLMRPTIRACSIRSRLRKRVSRAC
ncbi:MAG: hypothetical protein ACLQBD_23165 [Syntrophobacteraceae bacterium]